jgi:hypothetical protein
MGLVARPGRRCHRAFSIGFDLNRQALVGGDANAFPGERGERADAKTAREPIHIVEARRLGRQSVANASTPSG